MIPAIAAAVATTDRVHGSDFAELSHIIKRAGLLLRRRHGYYAAKSALTVAGFVAAWVVFGYLGDSWWQLFTAGFLALVCTQLPFIGHDAFALGGLNYQIEHHLFPSMPRPNLRRAQPIVRDFCVAHGISYSHCGLLRSYGHVLRHLHAVGAPLRVTRR